MEKEPIQIQWSDRLELLAERFFQCWEAGTQDPFQKCCVVVHDAATRDWLKQFYLLKKRGKKILLNPEFVMLPEFLNDFLAAQIRNLSPRRRRPAAHPYARGVLPWRIYHILEKNGSLPEFRHLAEYIGEDPASMTRRRAALSEKAAELLDDYLNYRYPLLVAWEKGKKEAGEEAWQSELYRKLVEEEPDTYAREYERFFRGQEDLSNAFANGFPRYSHVHIFDIPFLPLPSLEMLIAIGSVLPMTFWSFNPGGDWLADTPSKGDMIRRKADAIRAEFRRHLNSSADLREETSLPPESYDLPWERLFGALASGARPLLCAQICHPALSASPEDVLSSDPLLPPAIHFPRVEIAFHRTSSCFRELEVIRDGIHHYLSTHPDASPGDVRILCGDWEKYAPVADAVFSPERRSAGYLPVTLTSPLPGKSFIARTFLSLLEFRSNRFEVKSVFNLLGCEALRRKFSLSEEGVETLRDLVEKANIRWGENESDINAALAKDFPVEKEPWPFSWERGVDRMALDMLRGAAEEGEETVEAGSLGSIVPCGEIEGEREGLLVSLWEVIRALRRLRHFLSQHPRGTISFWRDFLWETIDAFFDPGESEGRDFAALRRSLLEVTESMANAGAFAEDVDAELLFSVLSSRIADSGTGRFSPESSVLFSPLTAASALPARAVWLCGLNEGVFPRIDHPASFDLLRNHPVISDVTTREKDSFALLKAALGARDFLAFSCFQTGREKGKPPVFPILLEAFADYFRSEKIPFACYDHPCSAFSPDYFTGEENLPPTFSFSRRHVAEILAAGKGPGAQEAQDSFAAFSLSPEGTTRIELADLADFYAEPNHYLVKKRLAIPNPFLHVLPEEPALEASLGKDLAARLLTDPFPETELPRLALRMTETGNSPDTGSAERAVRKFLESRAERWMMRPLSSPETTELPSPARENIRDAFARFSRWDEETEGILSFGAVQLHFSCRILPLETAESARCGIRFSFDGGTDVCLATRIRQWLIHLAGHAAGKRFFTLMLSAADAVVPAYPPLPENEAKETLQLLVGEAFRPLAPGYPDFSAALSHAADQPYQEEKWFGLLPGEETKVTTIRIGDKRKNAGKL